MGFQGERAHASAVDRINLGMDLWDLTIDTARVKNRDQPAMGGTIPGQDEGDESDAGESNGSDTSILLATR